MATRTARAPPRPRGVGVAAPTAASSNKARVPAVRKVEDKPKPKIQPVDVVAKLASPASCTLLLNTSYAKQLETSPVSAKPKLASEVLNAAKKSLNAAVASGFKAKSPVASTTAVAKRNGKAIPDEWSVSSLETVFAVSSTSLSTLRELESNGLLGAGKAIAIEQSAVQLLGKAFLLEMPEQAYKVVTSSRRHVIRLYNPNWTADELPAGDVDDAVAAILFAHGCSAMVAAPGPAAKLQLPHEDPMHPLILARRLPLTTTSAYLLLLFRTLKGSLNASLLGLLALTMTVENGKVTPAQIWNRAIMTFTEATASNSPEDVAKAITFMKRWVQDLPGNWDPSPMVELEVTLARRSGSIEAIEKAMGSLAVNDTVRLMAEIAKLEVSGNPTAADEKVLFDLVTALEGASNNTVMNALRGVERTRRVVAKNGGGQWLYGALTFAERLVKFDMDIALKRPLVAGAIDSAAHFGRQEPNPALLAFLQRVDTLRQAVDGEMPDWCRVLSAIAYAAAGRHWKQGDIAGAKDFTLFSCRVSQVDVPGRLELLSGCHLRSGEHLLAARALVKSLQAHPESLFDQITQGAASGPLSVVFNDPSMAEISRSIDRLALITSSEPSTSSVFDFITTPAFAAVGERVLSSLSDAPEELVLSLCQVLLKVYARMPIRRLRVATRMIELGHDVTVNVKAPYGQDAALAPFLMEYQGLLAIARATAAYYAAQGSSGMPQEVLKYAEDAAAALRPLIGKRKDDSKRLYAALDRLINLLGILGYPLAKVDCLRLLRQLQRKDVDAYALTSARLGHEYSKLGKVSRAAVVFAQANTTTVETQLRYAAFLASIGNVDKSAQTYLAAKETPVHRQILIALERAALAHTAIAVLSSAKDIASGLVRHLSLAVRAWTRAARYLDQKSQNAWAVTENLLECLFALAAAYLDRGSIRDAESCLMQTQTLAQSVHSAAYAARASTGLAAIKAGLRAYDESLTLLDAAGALINEGVSGIDVSRTRGDVLAKQAQEEEAEESFIQAVNAIDSLDLGFNTADSVLPSPRKPAKAEPILPIVLSHVLRQQAWLYHKAGLDEAQELMSRILSMALTAELRAAEQDLVGRMAMQDAFNQFKTDLFMNSLMESTISLPMGNTSKPTAAKGVILAVLERADRAFRTSLSLRAQSGRVVEVRQAYLSIAFIRAFQTALGQGSSAVTAAATSAINSSVAITLRRERLDRLVGDEMDWPSLPSPALTAEPSIDELPSDFAVVSITVSDDHATMFVSRQQSGREPLVFCLPLDRQSRRDGDDAFTLEAATAELSDIIQSSDASARAARGITSREGKSEWWAARRDLDKRLGELLATIEFCWLGAFKTVLNGAPPPSPALDAFKRRIETIFKRVLGCKRKVKLGIECFATLSPKCRTEELEDFVYFVLDLYQFHGVPVALAELDIDQIGIDVKAALHEYEATARSTATKGDLFLILDKNVQGIPWESIPALRGRPVSRVPSLDFLVDRTAGDIDDKNVFYVLNPDGDLVRTQEQFEPWVTNKGWKGITGRRPTEEELVDALSNYDLVLYFGHGGAEQYVRSTRIRKLPRCASTMLWGCSSGVLREQGDFDRTGTALHYMVGGCPSLTANLWDVTDRDIDRMCEIVFNRMGLGSVPTGTQSTSEAVNGARDACKLRYLTGAAPVVYGIPKRLAGIFSA